MPRDPWRSLEPVHIVSTAARLERRIRERFPDASLARLAGELLEVAREAAELVGLVFVGLAVVFLLGLERRLQRRRELRAIYELRSIAHIVDMHQLTKDPDRLRKGLPDTASSPDRSLGPVELARYLDYCSELLSLTGKITAIYGEGIDDPVVLGAVQQVEGLATGLSSKIWQKIMILDAAAAPRG